MAESQGEYVSVGEYLGQRLVDAGASTFFTVPGDYTLTLLDELLKIDRLNFVGCCNELNAGYAADGYARSTGKLGVVVVTYMVGALSAINAVAGGFAHDLPLLIVVGSPNSNDIAEKRIVHHTLGTGGAENQCLRCFEPVVTHSYAIHSETEAAGAIDTAIFMALTRMKPVYLEIACNVATASISRPLEVSVLPPVFEFHSDEKMMTQVTNSIKEAVESSDHVVLVAGSKMKSDLTVQGFMHLAEKLQCAVAIMPDAKGIIFEDFDAFVGCYWGEISSGCAKDFVETADLVIFVGPMLNDYTTVGWTSKLYASNTILIAKDHVHFKGKRFSYVFIDEILDNLREILPEKPVSLSKFKQMKSFKQIYDQRQSELTIAFLRDQLQANAMSYSNVIVDTGDSWFVGESLQIPKDTRFHIQMQYGSIGWALPASLGIGVAEKERAKTGKLLAIIGDGAFQVSAQELSTLIRQEIDAVILVINNKGYVIEQKIHPGDYNTISNWNYASFGESFGSQHSGVKVSTCEELEKVMREVSEKQGTFVVECCVAPDDCSPELTIWGSKVAEANRRE